MTCNCLSVCASECVPTAKGMLYLQVIEMLNAAADPETGFIKYDDYVATLACD